MGDKILSVVSHLDSIGVTTLHYRQVAVISAIFFLTMRYFIVSPKEGLHWHGLLHSVLSTTGAITCLYLDFYVADPTEPVRMVRCMGPLTNLHRTLPALSIGYALCDILDSLALGGDFLVHGLAFGTVMMIICELDLQHTITQMLLMEVSTIFLNLLHLDTFGPGFKMVMQIFFLISFSTIRLVIVPYLWGLFVYTFYRESASGAQTCFPHYFMYIVLLFGIFFHGLNAFWFVKIVKKVIRKLKGTEKMTDSKMN